MKKRIAILLFLPLALTAQRNVTGKITEAENNAPVVGASVFISNTTIGAFTDDKGNYKLQLPEGGAYRLTVSYIGYQSVFKDIEPGKASVEFNAALPVQEKELSEVTVTAKAKYRQGDIRLFWKTILGVNPSSKTIEVTNPEAVYYYYNPETQVLKVTCREPLKLVNYETGYRIQYVLNNFTHDYKKGITDWSNQFVFTPLETDNPKQKNYWEKKRRDVYNISLSKFIKSLYNNSLYDDGFVLANLRQSLDPTTPYQLSLLDPKSILTTSSTDNSKYLNLSGGQVALICFGRPVNSNDFYRMQNPQSKGFFKNSDLLMNLLNGESIRIFPDGTYMNRLFMTPINSSNTLLALNTKLPFEYIPDNVAQSTAENENELDIDSIIRHFDKQTYAFPQEKIHVQTDRNIYVPGERIWFKAYVTDATTFQSSTQSRYVYVDLISPKDSLAGRVMIRPDSDNMFYGHLFLSKIIPEGNYTLRAYTRYMENLGDDYIFKKNIRIENLASGKQPSLTEKENRRTQTTTGDLQLKPSYSLTVTRQNGKLTVGVQKPANSKDKDICYLLGQCREHVFHFAIMEKGSDSVDFQEEDLPAGVLQFVLFDEKMNPLSERLAFSKNYDRAKVEFHTDKALYNRREKVTATLSLTDSAGNSLEGNLSVAVTDDKDVAVDSATTILSSLLLTSELKGYIENPAYYLEENTESAAALDNLLMTHKWGRYNVAEIVKGNYASPQIPFQTSQEIIGRVKTKSVSDCKVSAMTKYGDLGSVATDKNGVYKFQYFEYPDSTAYYIQALGKGGGAGVELFVNGETFPKPINAPQSPVMENPVNKKEPNAFLAKAEQRSTYDEDMQTVLLGEAKINGKENKVRLQNKANSSSAVTISRKEIEKIRPLFVSDILRHIPGVIVLPDGKIFIGGGNISISSKESPLILIDGVLNNDLRLETVSVSDIESIDVFKGASAAVFGVRGAAGAISITTRKGANNIENISKKKARNYVIYTPLGYQSPLSFYSPDYEAADAKNSIIPDYRTTIFWKPDIVTSNTGEASFNFYTSDFPTTYSVVIEGLTNDGKIIRQVEKIRME